MATPRHRLVAMRYENDDMNSYAVNNSYIRPQLRARNGMFTAAVRMLVVLLALLVYATLTMDLITNFQGLVAYALLLLGYLYVEIRNLWTRETQLFWINPVVLASIFTFALAFGFSNILFLMSEETLALMGQKPTTPWMNQLMLLVVLGACSMWLGYSSGVGRNMGLMLQQSSVLRKWMSLSFRVNRRALFACIAISLMARLLTIKLGLYGYSSTYDQLIAGAAYREYLTVAESLGKLALVGVAMKCFSSPRSAISDRLLLGLVLGYEVAFGFISGFKGLVVIPFIIVGIVYYSQRNRLPLWLIPAVVVGIIAAYAVIEPFRAASRGDAGFDGTSPVSIVSTMISASASDAGGRPSMWLRILSRINLTYIASLGIEYAANNELPAGSPEFLDDILLAPAHAFIPRLLWGSKSLHNSGLWYANQVMGVDGDSGSFAMSSFTYLNFAGGPLAVILGFLLVGILQRGLFDGLRHFGGGGLIVLFGLLNTLVNIDNAFNFFIVSIIRYLPILVVAQYVLIQRPHRSFRVIWGKS